MHLPLIDIPKPRRSRRPHSTVAALLLGLCAAVVLSRSWSQFWGIPREEHSIVCDLPVFREASPVQYVTVLTIAYEIPLTHPMPLMELYDELCEVKRDAQLPFSNCIQYREEEKEMFSLHAEKKFAAKYGLTLKQVEEIKRDGYRLKHGAGE